MIFMAKTLLPSTSTWSKEFKEINQNYGITAPIITNQPSMEKVVQGAMVKLTNGQIDVETCYNEIKQGIDDIKASVS